MESRHPLVTSRMYGRAGNKMDQNELQWDKLLKIKTTGRDDSHSDQYHFPYEPTPYCVLERLANMYFWIMEPEKGVCAFSCPIRQDAAPLESNMKNGSLPGQKKINAMRYPASEPHLQ